jgi:hypothetical protein
MRIFLLFLMLIFAGCGGGGGSGNAGGNGNDGGVEPPINLLPSYNFFLENLQGDSPLTAVVGESFTVTVDIVGLLPGGLDLGPGSTVTDVRFDMSRIRESARIDLTVASPEGSPLDGTFAAIVTEELMFLNGESLLSGAFNVVAPAETVTVTVSISDAMIPWAEISLNGGEPIVYTLEELMDLLDDETADAWQRRAALATGAIQFTMEQFLNVADVLDTLEAVTLRNPTISTCDMFTGSPPDGVLAQGEVTITWLGSGELSDGDDFTWEFNQCWSADYEELIHGTVTLQDYTETVDTNTNTLFEIGFGGIGDVPGGAIFEFTVSETVENLGEWAISAEDVITVTGGFSVTIQAP